MTVQDLVSTALGYCGQMRPGAIPGPDIMNVGLKRLVAFYDTWNAERTMQYNKPDYVFPITGSGHGTTGNGQTFGGAGYQIGPTALDFVCERPVDIVRMNLYLTAANPAQPARIPMGRISMEEWTTIAVPDLTPINVALVYAYDTQFPNAVIWVWPPLNGNSLEIFTWGTIPAPTSLGSSVSYPPGYQEAIEWTLAQKMWPFITQTMMPNKLPLPYITGQAKKHRDRIKALNNPTPRFGSDFRASASGRSPECSWSLLFEGIPY